MFSAWIIFVGLNRNTPRQSVDSGFTVLLIGCYNRILGSSAKPPSLAQGRARHLYGSIVGRDERADQNCDDPLAVVCMQSDISFKAHWGAE